MPSTLELAKAHVAAEDRRDVQATLDTFTDDCVYTMGCFGLDLKGKKVIGEHYSGAFNAFPDFFNYDSTYYDSGDDVWLKVRLETTHNRTWHGIEPTGRKLSVWSVAHFPRAPDGRLKGEHVYFNGNEFLYQLGMLPSANALEIAEHIRKLEARIAELEGRRR